MRPYTETRPKALVPVLGRPFVDLQLEWLAAGGVTSVVFCVGYLAGALRDHVGGGAAWGLHVEWVDEGEELRGTAGALRLALDSGALAERFFVLYGDSYLPVALGPVWQSAEASPAPALMTVFRNEGQWDTSNVWFENSHIRLYDKRERLSQMRHIDWGLSMIRSEALAARPAGEPFDLGDFYSDLSRQGKLAGYEVTTRFYEIGSAAGLEETDALLRSQSL